MDEGKPLIVVEVSPAGEVYLWCPPGVAGTLDSYDVAVFFPNRFTGGVVAGDIPRDAFRIEKGVCSIATVHTAISARTHTTVTEEGENSVSELYSMIKAHLAMVGSEEASGRRLKVTAKIIEQDKD